VVCWRRLPRAPHNALIKRRLNQRRRALRPKRPPRHLIVRKDVWVVNFRPLQPRRLVKRVGHCVCVRVGGWWFGYRVGPRLSERQGSRVSHIGTQRRQARENSRERMRTEAHGSVSNRTGLRVGTEKDNRATELWRRRWYYHRCSVQPNHSNREQQAIAQPPRIAALSHMAHGAPHTRPSFFTLTKSGTKVSSHQAHRVSTERKVGRQWQRRWRGVGLTHVGTPTLLTHLSSSSFLRTRRGGSGGRGGGAGHKPSRDRRAVNVRGRRPRHGLPRRRLGQGAQRRGGAQCTRGDHGGGRQMAAASK